MIPNVVLTSGTEFAGDPLSAEVEVKNSEEEPDDRWWKSTDQILMNDLTIRRVCINGSLCLYRGEGNANVVLAVPSERNVIRFRKSSSSPSTEGGVSPDGGWSRTAREVDFQKYVIPGFLGAYIQPPQVLRVTPEDMIRINEAIRPLRPEHRMGKEIVEEWATTFMDYAFLRKEISAVLRSRDQRPTFCVEIKPKQGFRPPNDEQFRKCTYCLTQYHKLKIGAVSSRSRYCPLDLFSGSEDRVRKSLWALLDSPQNNLKIFRNGVVVYDCNSVPGTAEAVLAEWVASGDIPRTNEQNFEVFFRLVSAALFREFSTDRGVDYDATESPNSLEKSSRQSSESQTRFDANVVERAKRILSLSEECSFLGDEIPSGSVLGRILGMQRLPYHSFDRVYRVYSKHLGTLDDESFYSQMVRMCRAESKVSVKSKEKDGRRAPYSSSASRPADSDTNGNDNYKATEIVSQPMDLRNNNNVLRDERNGRDAINNIEEFQLLKNYLLSTTAKDCSVLMAFQEIDSTDLTEIPEQFIVQSEDGVNFVVNVGVLDLDPKSVHCVEKHRLRDTDVLVSLADLLGDKINRSDVNLSS